MTIHEFDQCCVLGVKSDKSGIKCEYIRYLDTVKEPL